MFWSKIWFFLIVVAGVTALTIALVLPRPAERKAKEDEERRLADACAVTNILLTENARVRIDLAGDFSRVPAVAKVLDAATKASAITPEHNKNARDAADELLNDTTGTIKPAFVYMLDAQGRVVARAGRSADWTQYGDSLEGYYIVKDALHGYLRDDLWLLDQTLYRVAAAPVVNREVGVRDRYAGAVVLGHPVDKDLAASLASQVRFNVSFYVAGQAVANSTTEQLHKDMLEEFERVKDVDRERVADCAENKPFIVSSGADHYAALIARLPGEASDQGAFYSVYVKRPKAIGFLGTLDAVDGKDLSFGNFPWIAVGLVLVLVVGLGMFLMVWEADRPLKKLANDAVLLAKGEKDRLQEDTHRGKFGSIARSVNIQLDKQDREAKAAKKDLDQLLGPAPEDSLAGAPNPLPPMGPGGLGGGLGDFKPPPPSEFKFKDSSPLAAAPKPPPTGGRPSGGGGFDLDLPPPPPSVGGKPPEPPPLARPTDARVPPPPVALPKAAAPPPPVPRRPATPPPLAAAGIDDDILGGMGSLDDEMSEDDAVDDAPTATRPPSDFDAPTRVADPSRALLEQSADVGESQESSFQRVFDDFLALKKKCGESTANLTFEKFTAKLKKNRQALMTKHGCKEVRFQVYIKDGRAALKATPVKG